MSDTDLTGLSDDALNQMIQLRLKGQMADPAHPLASAVATDAPANAGADLSQLSDEQLNALIATRPTPQMQGWQREVALPASNFAKGAVEGVGGIGSAVRNLGNAYEDYYAVPVSRALRAAENWARPGLVDPEPTRLNFDNPYTAERLLDTTRNLGLTDRPDLQPQNLREKYEAAAARGAGSTVPFVAAGGGAGAARALTTGATAGVGSQAAGDAFPNHPILAPLVGGVIGAAGGNLGYNAAARGANIARGVNGDLIEAYRRQGMTPQLAGDVSSSAAVRDTQAYLMKSLGGAGRVHEAAGEAAGQFGEAVDRIASNLGDSESAFDAGSALQQYARDWYNRLWPRAQSAAWAPVDQAIAPNAPVHLDGLVQTARDISGNAGRLQPIADKFVPPEARDLLDQINRVLAPPSPATPGFFSQLRNPNPQALLPAQWQEVQALRRSIGDALGDQAVSQSIGEQNLRRLYGAISGDMRNTAQSLGVGDAFDAANQYSTIGHAFMENTLAKIIASPRNRLQESIAPEQAAANILNGGDRDLIEVAQRLPGGARELAAFKLRDAARASPGTQNGMNTQIAPNQFLTDINKLEQRAPHGFDALFRDVAPDLNDMRQIAGGMRLSSTRLNTSNTGLHGEFGSIPARAAIGYEAAEHMMPGSGVAGAAASTVAGPAINRLGAAIMTSPTAARYFGAPVSPWLARQRLVSALAPTYSTALEPHITVHPPPAGTQQPDLPSR